MTTFAFPTRTDFGELLMITAVSLYGRDVVISGIAAYWRANYVGYPVEGLGRLAKERVDYDLQRGNPLVKVFEPAIVNRHHYRNR